VLDGPSGSFSLLADQIEGGETMMLAEATTWGEYLGSGMFGFMIAFVLMFYLWAREHPEDL
jgi:hypothetical protein